MSLRLIAALAAVLVLGACSAKSTKQQPSEDPFVAAANDELALADTDTLTYDFLAETQPEPEQAGRYADPEPDLPVLSDEVEETVAEAPAVPPTTAKPAEEQPAVPEATMPPAEDEGPLFWVQIFASSNRQSAEEFALAADGRLEERVRILYLEPYYRCWSGATRAASARWSCAGT